MRAVLARIKKDEADNVGLQNAGAPFQLAPAFATRRCDRDPRRPWLGILSQFSSPICCDSSRGENPSVSEIRHNFVGGTKFGCSAYFDHLLVAEHFRFYICLRFDCSSLAGRLYSCVAIDSTFTGPLRPVGRHLLGHGAGPDESLRMADQPEICSSFTSRGNTCASPKFRAL
jgi:hypothetical protein